MEEVSIEISIYKKFKSKKKNLLPFTQHACSLRLSRAATRRSPTPYASAQVFVSPSWAFVPFSSICAVQNRAPER
jgi:hypothetical protein